jgi:hypothetical protein
MNLRTLIVCLIAAMLFSCKEGQKLQSKDGYAVVPSVSTGEAVATFAGGCFWAMQECMIELKGVNKEVLLKIPATKMFYRRLPVMQSLYRFTMIQRSLVINSLQKRSFMPMMLRRLMGRDLIWVQIIDLLPSTGRTMNTIFSRK